MSSASVAQGTEAVFWRCPVKNVFLRISQNSLENTCARGSFLIKLQALVCNLIKKETLAQVFPCEIWRILKNTFFIEHLLWLLLELKVLVEEDEVLIRSI